MQTNVDVDVTELVNALAAEVRNMRDRAKSAISEASNHGYQTTRALAPYRTGGYQDSIRLSLYNDKNTYHGEWGTDDFRGFILEYGSNRRLKDGTTRFIKALQPHFEPGLKEAHQRLCDSLDAKLGSI